MLERTSERLWPDFLLKAESAMRSDQVLQGFMQSGLEYLQGQRVKNDRSSCGATRLLYC